VLRSVDGQRASLAWRGASLAIVAVAFLAVLAILLMFVLHFHRAYFTSDDAVVNMLAGSMGEQGRLLPEGWVNNNGDLMMPSAALVVAPLLRWMPNGFRAHSIAGGLAVVCLLAALMGLLRILKMPWIVVLVVATLLASGISYQFGNFVFAQTTYFWWPVGFLFGALLICADRRVMARPFPNAWIGTASLFAAVFSISFANPQRGLLMLVLPLYAFDRALAAARIPRGETNWIRRWCHLSGFGDRMTISLAASFAAALITYETLKFSGVTESVYNAAGLHLADWKGVWRHAEIFATGWFFYLGAEPFSNGLNPAIEGVLRLVRGVFAVGLTLVGLREIWCLPSQRDPVRRALVVALLVAFVPVLIIYLAFDPLAIDYGTTRYFQVAIFILLVLAAFQLRDFDRAMPRFATWVLAVAALLLVPVSAQRFLPLAKLGSAAFWDVTNVRVESVAAVLRREGLRWGYASWWNAGVTTVLSESAVHISPVEFLSSGVVSAGPVMTSHDWYRPARWKDETFLLLSPGEADAAKLVMLAATLGEPKRMVESGGYRVQVYDHNIAADFGCLSRVPTDQRIDKRASTARLLSAQLSPVAGAPARLATVRVRNEGTTTLSGWGRFPLSVGVELLSRDGAVVKQNWARMPLPCPLAPGDEREIRIPLPHAAAGEWNIRVDLVQEGVAWFRDRGMKTIELRLQQDAS